MKNAYEVRGSVTAIFLRRKDGTVLETLIDTADFGIADSFPNKWYAGGRGIYCYAIGKLRSTREGIKTDNVRLNRFILGYVDNLKVDHINHNTLNNTRRNLRIATQSQNTQNLSGAYATSKSGVRGVVWNQSIHKWRAQVRLMGKHVYSESFADLDAAKQAVIEARAKFLPFSQEALEAQSRVSNMDSPGN